jgi:hypothetical protein
MANQKISAMTAATSLGSTDVVPIVQGGANKGITGASLSASLSAPYFQTLAALLEPLALEQPQVSSFAYAITGNPKYVMASYHTQLQSGGWFDVRDPRQPLALAVGQTFQGFGGDACALILNPALVATYANAESIYYSRRATLDAMTPGYQPLVGPGSAQSGFTDQTVYPFYPGPYGTIIRYVHFGNTGMIVLNCEFSGADNFSINFFDEVAEAFTAFSAANSMFFPVAKWSACSTQMFTSGGADSAGGILFYQLPANWGTVADPISPTYLFRDDFLSGNLNLWTVTQSGGTVAIDPNYKWCKLDGSGSFNNAGMLCKTSFTRASAPRLVVDWSNNGSNGIGIGFGDGGGINYTNLAAGILVADGVLSVYELGTLRTVTGGPTLSTENSIYRIRITANSNNTNTYEIQGNGCSGPVGSATWQTLAVTGSSNTTTPLYPTIVGYLPTYISDVRVY